MTLAGLVGSPIASASENDGGISATFAAGSSVLSDDQKAAIKKALASSSSDATFIVTGTAGKLPGVSDSKVKRLAKARAKAIKAYLVSLGVSKTRVTTQTKMTEIGETPKSIGSNPTPAPTPSVTAINSTGTGSGSSSGGGGTPTVTCATGGTCIVGDRGPGGGIVYYVDNVGFSCGPTLAATCKHLEVAPIGWTGVGTEFYFPYWPYLVWATGTGSPTPSGNVILDITDITNDASPYNNASGIGLGYKNSVAIVTQGNDTTTAAGAARAYAGGSKNDWYLPTAAELNLLCQWNHNVTQNVSTLCIASGATLNTGTGATGSGLGGDSYWSSSETGSGNAWLQDFYGGAQDSRGKSRDNVVRPIRAF